jgi:hypothetical protein
MAPKPKVEPQQRGHTDADEHQHTAHGGGAALAQVGLHAIAADGLADLHGGQAADDPRPEGQADQQGGHGGHHGTEGQVLENAQESQVFREQGQQPLTQAQQHEGPSGVAAGAC